MAFLDFLKKQKKEGVKKTPEERHNIKTVNERHRRRISNLSEQLEELKRDLLKTEQDLELSEPVKGKKSNKIVQQMTLINHEIAIREKLLSWL